ncbi:uncharacterized protein DNG_06974 [Cephalotrichum gorgonifer]|uniref:Xylanolytic transcriptional activator regulatory domain-containing protein n=1 Tax=Cephalotrichum gorgonifer TaxID=2041049 RepID=A0AAE8SWY9_9PEZI|nr:uncharacterized protein DNG_06974 [Cephalotrichum gorgonifer]
MLVLFPRERKTKCDRGTPCSSCVTAGLSCRAAQSRPEKRQRVLISARYDEALESVDRRLQELQQTVNALHCDVGRSQEHSQPTLVRDCNFTPGSSNGWVPALPAASGGYRGSSSFDYQARRVRGTLASLAAHLPLQATENSTTAPHLPHHADVVLKLLRLAQIEKQRFFVDVFLLDEQEFSDLCREVFFAVNPYTLYTWSIVNVGLFYLFRDLNMNHYAEIGLDSYEVDRTTELLAANARSAVERFPTCSEPCIEACQALALLGIFCIKSGQILRAWSMISTAARICIDLGLHTMPPKTTPDQDLTREVKLFWNVYLMDTSLALTLGRTQSIHLHDISREYPSRNTSIPGIPGKIYAVYFDMVILEGEIQPQLFSAAAQRLPPHIRAQRVREFRTRIGQIRAEFSRIRSDPNTDSPFGESTVLLDLLLHSLATLICGAFPRDIENPGSAQKSHTCSDCVETAREGLTTLVMMGNASKSRENLKGWAILLNMYLSLAPFTPYLTLLTHAISEFATSDLDLLAAVNAVLELVANDSLTVKHCLETCTKLCKAAESVIATPFRNIGTVEGLLPSHTSAVDGFEPGVLCLQEPASSVSASSLGISLGDYQMILAGLDADPAWVQT